MWKSIQKMLLFICIAAFLWLLLSCQDGKPTIVTRIADHLTLEKGVETIDRYFGQDFNALVLVLKRTHRPFFYGVVERRGKTYGVIRYGPDDEDPRVQQVYVSFSKSKSSEKGLFGGLDSMVIESTMSPDDWEFHLRSISECLSTEPEPFRDRLGTGFIWKDAASEKEAILIRGSNDLMCLSFGDASEKLSWLMTDVKEARYTEK